MHVINWTDDLSVGVDVVDADHKRLVDMMNTLFVACYADQGPTVLGPIVTELLDYTNEHFRREGEAMEKHGFPELERHRKLHEKLTGKVQEIQQSIRTGADTALSNEVLAFMRDWWIDHIQGEDMKFANFLRERGLDFFLRGEFQAVLGSETNDR